MRILALDTASERCSVALLMEERLIERSAETSRAHAELILPMIAEVLREGEIQLNALDGLAYGRGPGAFTGVRIAIGVVQGLAFGARLQTVGVSDLAAAAQQVAQPGDEVLVCMDARMGEVYWGRFLRPANELLVRPSSVERVDPPEAVTIGDAAVLVGTGFKAYPQLAAGTTGRIHADVLPRAREVALLAAPVLRAGGGLPAVQAAPVYLRDEVASKK